MKIRLHLLAIPHTITTNFFSHCAFTTKVLRFSPMMRSRPDFEVYHYGVETSESGADLDVNLMTVKEWEELRVKSYVKLHPEVTEEEARKLLDDKKAFVGDLANWSTPLYEEFNRRARLYLQLYYRSKQTDIVCIPFGPAYVSALHGFDCVKVETGIGYNNAYEEFRIYESYAILHTDLEREHQSCRRYWFVAPNYYNVDEWAIVNSKGHDIRKEIEEEKQMVYTNNATNISAVTQLKVEVLDENHYVARIGFLGRIAPLKGCYTIVEIAKKFPQVEFILCGQGNPNQFLNEQEIPNLKYKEPIHGRDRAIYLHSLDALLCPSEFMEPFCGVNVEAQLCGLPVLTHEYGAMVDTVEPFKTGLHCHTLADFCYGVQMVLDGKFDKEYIRKRAESKYDMFEVAKRYEYIFKTILDIYDLGKNGWYSPDTYIDILKPIEQESKELQLVIN